MNEIIQFKQNQPTGMQAIPTFTIQGKSLSRISLILHSGNLPNSVHFGAVQTQVISEIDTK